MELLILQIANGWEILAIENKTKATLYDEFIKQFIIKMGELLEEVKIEFKRWHFEQTRKYTNALQHKFIGFMGSFKICVKFVISWVRII